MDNIPKKRKRSENWSSNDKNLLKDLCADRIKIVENKCVDTNTNRMKRDCWAQILSEFNSACDVQRDIAQIQFQWKSMKLRAKAAESSYRKSKNRTGGGPPPKSPSKDDQEIIDLIPNEFKTDSNEFDSDRAALQNLEVEEFYIEDIQILKDYEDCDKENAQEDNYINANTSTPKPSIIRKDEKKKNCQGPRITT